MKESNHLYLFILIWIQLKSIDYCDSPSTGMNLFQLIWTTTLTPKFLLEVWKADWRKDFGLEESTPVLQ